MSNLIFTDTFFEINLCMLGTYILSYFLINDIISRTKYPINKRSNLVTRIISCIHAFLSTYGSYLYVNDYIGYDEWNSKYIMISKMYIIYDTMIILLNFNAKELIHHIVFYIGITTNIPLISKIAAKALFAELSNFNLYAGWFLLSIGKNNTVLFKINAFMLLLVYFCFRIVNYGLLTYETLNLIGFQFRFFVIFSLWIMNMFWFRTLIYKAINMYQVKRVKNNE